MMQVHIGPCNRGICLESADAASDNYPYAKIKNRCKIKCTTFHRPEFTSGKFS